MMIASSDDDRIQQDPQDGGIWATASPLQKEIHAESFRAMKATLAVVDRRILAIALATRHPGFSTGDVSRGSENEHLR